jgi:hypothetical protein
MRKILIATPLKGEIPPPYVQTLITLLFSRMPDTKFIWAFVGGTTVQWARDECVTAAVKYQCTHILFWDKDLKPTMEQVMRLLSHDVDVVASLYVKRNLNTHWHVFGDPQNKEERTDGLMKVLKVAIGFSLIKVSAFEKLRSFFPERQYFKHDGGEDPVTLHEFFPMGIVGKNSNDGKLRRIRELAKSVEWDSGGPGGSMGNAGSVMYKIATILAEADYSENQIRGEDFYFCEMCVEAGVPMYVDTELIIAHTGEIDLPIPTPQLLAMLKEDWRADEVRALQQPKQSEEPIITS